MTMASNRCCAPCSSSESGREVFMLSRHGRLLEWAVVAQEIHAFIWVSYGSAKSTGHRSLCSSCESGRGVFTLSRHGRPMEWAVVAQEVWRWPDSQVDAHDDVWPACLLSLGLPSGEGNLPFIEVS